MFEFSIQTLFQFHEDIMHVLSNLLPLRFFIYYSTFFFRFYIVEFKLVLVLDNSELNCQVSYN